MSAAGVEQHDGLVVADPTLAAEALEGNQRGRAFGTDEHPLGATDEVGDFYDLLVRHGDGGAPLSRRVRKIRKSPTAAGTRSPSAMVPAPCQV
jgi:hypothetical protein